MLAFLLSMDASMAADRSLDAEVLEASPAHIENLSAASPSTTEGLAMSRHA